MLEHILRFSIERRWVVVLATLAVAALGAWSLVQLPIDAVPDITNNQVQINTLVPAFSPEQVERQVTFPVETALAGISGLQYTRSLSRDGFSQVTAVFGDGVDIYFARNQIAERLTDARQHLPPGAEPKMGPISTGLGEVYMWAVEYAHPHGRHAPATDEAAGWQTDGTYLTPEGQRLETELELASYLREVQDWIIRPQLKNIAGVAGVDVVGGYEKQYQVQPDPVKMVGLGVSFDDLITALRRNNVSAGAGYIEHNGTSYPVRIGGLLKTSTEVLNVVVGQHRGTPVRVSDVAVVRIGSDLRTGSASTNGREAVVGTAMMLIGANSRTVASAVDAKMAEINRSLPPDIRATTVYNRTKLVKSTIHTVAQNLAEGAILVVVVLFLMLGNIPAALITALAIPLSMLMTATGMVGSRISGNLMSLGAIDFGIIVDGAVIIVENCLRLLAEKQHELKRMLTLRERLDVVFFASKQVRGATAFGEIIIITVYLPVLALTGIEGKMFHPMAMTVIFALVAALILSLTFIPALVAIGVRGRVREQENLLVRLAKRVYQPLLRLGSPPALAGGRGGRGTDRGDGWLIFPIGPGIHPHARRARYSRFRGACDRHQPYRRPGNAVRRRARREPIARSRLGLLQNGNGRSGGGPNAAEFHRHVRHSEASLGMARSQVAQGAIDRTLEYRAASGPGHQLQLQPADSNALQ